VCVCVCVVQLAATKLLDNIFPHDIYWVDRLLCVFVFVMHLAAMNVVNKMLTHKVQEMGTAAQEREQRLMLVSRNSDCGILKRHF
jgi:hypothetical protein